MFTGAGAFSTIHMRHVRYPNEVQMMEKYMSRGKRYSQYVEVIEYPKLTSFPFAPSFSLPNRRHEETVCQRLVEFRQLRVKSGMTLKTAIEGPFATLGKKDSNLIVGQIEWGAG